MHKNTLFLLKNYKNYSALGAPPRNDLRRLQKPTSPPDEFLATSLSYSQSKHIGSCIRCIKTSIYQLY